MAEIVDADYSAERFAVDGTKSIRIGTFDRQTHTYRVELVLRSKIEAVARSVQSWQDFVEVIPLRVGWPHAKRLWKSPSCLAASFRTGPSCHSRLYTTWPEPSVPTPGCRIASAVHAKRARDSFSMYCLPGFRECESCPPSFKPPRGAPPGSSEYQTETDFVPLTRGQSLT